MKNSIWPRVYFILVNYNGDKDTIDCINSINDSISYGNYGIIVVDNSPDDKSFNILRNQNLKETILIKSQENKGFAAGCNLGINKANELGYDFVILLNNDTIVKSHDLIEQLLLGFEKYKNVGICGGKILYFDHPNEIWYAAGYLSKVRLRAKNRNTINGIIETPFITGCLQMISRDTIDSIGLLSEEYFMLYEDADYCIRAQLNGFKTVYNSDAEIYHKVSKSMPSSSPTSIYYSNRARFIFIKKYQDKNYISKLCYWIELFIKIAIYKDKKKSAVIKVLKEIR